MEQIDKEYIEKEIEKGNTSSAIDRLIELKDSMPFYRRKTVINFSNRFKRLKREKDTDQIEYGRAGIQLNKLNDAILNFTHPPKYIAEFDKRWKIYSIGLLFVVFIIGSIFYPHQPDTNFSFGYLMDIETLSPIRDAKVVIIEEHTGERIESKFSTSSKGEFIIGKKNKIPKGAILKVTLSCNQERIMPFKKGRFQFDKTTRTNVITFKVENCK